MARPSAHAWIALWERALDEEIGIAFKVSGIPREQFRNLLYEARKASGDPRFGDLIMFAPNAPCDDELWICKKAVELEA